MVAFTAMQGVAYRIMPTIQELVWPILGPHGAFYSYSYAVRVKGAVEDMLATMLLYLLFSCYHLFKIKWRNQANIPLHSYDDGTPNFQWLANIVAWILNILAAPLLWLFFYMLPRALRKGKPFPKLITDKAAFTGMFIEPAIVFFFAWVSSSVESLWLYISGFAVLIYAQWKEMAKKNKLLDFQDGRIEAEMMRELRKGTTEKTGGKKKEPVKDAQTKQPFVPHIIVPYPDLTAIIEEMNREKIGARSAR